MIAEGANDDPALAQLAAAGVQQALENPRTDAQLRHRLLLSFAAEAEGKSADDVVAALVRAVPLVRAMPLG